MLVEAPYLFLYSLISDGVEIVRVLHGDRILTPRYSMRGWNDPNCSRPYGASLDVSKSCGTAPRG